MTEPRLQETNSTGLIGTRWRNLGGGGAPSGGTVTVERVVDIVAYGKWDSGDPWADHIDFLPKYYVEVDGGPTVRPPR